MTSAAEHISLSEMKDGLSEVVDRLEREHRRVVIDLGADVYRRR